MPFAFHLQLTAINFYNIIAQQKSQARFLPCRRCGKRRFENLINSLLGISMHYSFDCNLYFDIHFLRAYRNSSHIVSLAVIIFSYSVTVLILRLRDRNYCNVDCFNNGNLYCIRFTCAVTAGIKTERCMSTNTILTQRLLINKRYLKSAELKMFPYYIKHFPKGSHAANTK
jgi:hypothetical protein